MYLIFGYDSGLDSIEWIGNQMSKSRKYSSSDSLMCDGGFLLDLWYMDLSMCLMILSHYMRFF